MAAAIIRRLPWAGSVLILTFILGCNSEEESLAPPPPRRETIETAWENPVEIEVDAERQWALLLHDRTASSGTALELVDLASRSVVRTRILDYYDVFDAVFLPDGEACFAGRPQGNVGYAVQFFSLPNLTLGARVMTAADTAGVHGYLAVDAAGGFVYYSHAGGGVRDGVFKIAVSTNTVVDADTDGEAPFAFDNGLVSGLFNHPARIFFDDASQKLVVANLGDDYITLIDAAMWGTLRRASGHTFPVAGVSHLSTVSSELGAVRAEAMAGADGVYVLAGDADGTAYLSRFGVESNGLDFLQPMPGREWRYRNASLSMHVRQDVFSVFVAQRDSSGYGIGQYRLNNLSQHASSPYHLQSFPDSSVSAVAVDTTNDRLVVGASSERRLELVGLQP